MLPRPHPACEGALRSQEGRFARAIWQRGADVTCRPADRPPSGQGSPRGGAPECPNESLAYRRGRLEPCIRLWGCALRGQQRRGSRGSQPDAA
eukprot:scaffold301100_cov27-Tisochrysis_lutea.AAC.2